MKEPVKPISMDKINLKGKALLVIEALCSDSLCYEILMDGRVKVEDVSLLGRKLSNIYTYAHIAQGKCENKHPEWLKSLEATYRDLKEDGII
jgi:hypothetical protein